MKCSKVQRQETGNRVQKMFGHDARLLLDRFRNMQNRIKREEITDRDAGVKQNRNTDGKMGRKRGVNKKIIFNSQLSINYQFINYQLNIEDLNID